MHQNFHKEVYHWVKYLETKDLKMGIAVFSVLASLSFMSAKYILKTLLLDPHIDCCWDTLIAVLIGIVFYIGIGSILIVRSLTIKLYALENKIPRARLIKYNAH